MGMGVYHQSPFVPDDEHVVVLEVAVDNAQLLLVVAHVRDDLMHVKTGVQLTHVTAAASTVPGYALDEVDECALRQLHHDADYVPALND